MSAGEDREGRIKEFARLISDQIDVLKAERPKAEILDLKAVSGGRREPQLSDTELVAVRRMLADFEKIANGCPTARYVLDR